MAEITESKNFIHNFIEEDIAPGGQFAGKTVHTRFPPEPNGYLHIGHCKALIIDFGTAEKFGGLCNLRMDDTNPTKEDTEFVDAIQEDIHWLGFDWGDRFFYGSDYFEKDYEYAVELIKKGLAYVCELTPEQFKEYRGDVSTPASSPYRDRPVEESLWTFSPGCAPANSPRTIAILSGPRSTWPPATSICVTRLSTASAICTTTVRETNGASIPCTTLHTPFRMPWRASPTPCALWSLRITVLFTTGWWSMCLCPAIHGRSSLPGWASTIRFMSKRKLRKLVENGYVSGWDDPRMPTLCGLRRRGYTPASIRNFCDRVGVAKSPNTIEYAFLEHCLREDLNETAKRVMAVLKPVKLTITNYPEGQSETFLVENNPNDAEAGSREITFSRDLWIEGDDFLAQPIPKYKRLYPDGPECRLKGAYVIKCTGCVTDENGNVTEVLATYDPDSKGGDPADGRKIKGATIHWVDANNCYDAEVRQYSNLFEDPDPDAAGKDFLVCLNPNSLEVLQGCKVEASLKNAKAPESYQFMRLGYFCPDSKDSSAEHLVFNRSVSLKDSFKPAK